MENIVILLSMVLQSVSLTLGASMFSMTDIGSKSATIRSSFITASEHQETDLQGLSRILKSLTAPPELSDEDFKLLTFQLGDSYNADYMSINEPRSLKARDPIPFGRKMKNAVEQSDKMRTFPKMSDQLKNMKLRKVYSKEPKSNKRRSTFGKKTSHRIKNWLWDLSKCPVFYQWYDLGKNVFPRYIKRGACSKKKTCSYPAGMTCQKKGFTAVNALLYFCFKDMNSVKVECKWRPFELHVLSECKCGCNSNS